RYSPETIKVTVDGDTKTTPGPRASIGTITSARDFIIGAGSDLATDLFKGDFAEVAVIPGTISDVDVVKFDNYAQSEWGGLTLCAPTCAGTQCGADTGCGSACDCNATCTADSQCSVGFICLG